MVSLESWKKFIHAPLQPGKILIVKILFSFYKYCLWICMNMKTNSTQWEHYGKVLLNFYCTYVGVWGPQSTYTDLEWWRKEEDWAARCANVSCQLLFLHINKVSNNFGSPAIKQNFWGNFWTLSFHTFPLVGGVFCKLTCIWADSFRIVSGLWLLKLQDLTIFYRYLL